jgi:hypothetical protein
MTERMMTLGDELFSFSSEQDWVNRAKNLYANCGVPRGHYITIDSVGRICKSGRDFMRATREEAYPIKVYAHD